MGLPTQYQEFIHLSKYSRWNETLQRRETWEETIDRYIEFFKSYLNDNPNIRGENLPILYNKLDEAREAILNLEVVPSMRALKSAGKALKSHNAAGYNCCYISIDHPHAFDEILYLSCCGCGNGFSVENKYISKLPDVPEELHPTNTVIQIADSKIGWASGLRELISLLYAGKIPKWDVSKVRPYGAILKTFGGRACLTGETIVYKDKRYQKGYDELTINDLLQMKYSRGKWEHKANHFKDIKLRSLDEETGEFFRNNLIDIIDNGIQPVYEIVTEKGYRIKATDIHRFMNSVGDYQFLSEFNIDDYIAVNGNSKLTTGICMDCGIIVSRRAIRCRMCANLNQRKEDCNAETSRGRIEVKNYRSEFDCCELCFISETEKRLEVHHKDGNPWNNKDLMFDKIISIEYIGNEKVYDLQMQGPNHNFVANGFISHNSGPKPLVELFEFVISIFKKAAGRKLNSLQCHDIICKIGLIAESGGTRRAALISLSDIEDPEMRHAKSGNWWETNSQRSYANNSAVYNSKPELGVFLKEWTALYRGKSGERGICNLYANKATGNVRRDWSKVQGTNPCSEIALRSAEMCNLSEVIVRSEDGLGNLIRKVEIATFLGTLQSMLTNFKYLRNIWKKNCEEERLLGVSLTGILDNDYLLSFADEILPTLKETAIKTNTYWANILGINASTAITCIKPSGNVSQLTNTASGIHPRYSPYYIRTVRMDKNDPLSRLMVDQGFPVEDCVMKPDNTYIFSFPIKSPNVAIFRDSFNAIQQLELWKKVKQGFVEHTISNSIYVKEHEWLDVAAWVYNNFNIISGLSFFPYDGGIYKQAPYQECTKEEYESFLDKMPKDVDWSKIAEYEKEDQTTSSREGACFGGACEL